MKHCICGDLPSSKWGGQWMFAIELLLKYVVEEKYTLPTGTRLKEICCRVVSTSLNSQTCYNHIAFRTHHETRVTRQSSVLLHIFITNVSMPQYIARVLPVDISDHLPIFAWTQRNISTQIKLQHSSWRFHVISLCRLELFYEQLGGRLGI